MTKKKKARHLCRSKMLPANQKEKASVLTEAFSFYQYRF